MIGEDQAKGYPEEEDQKEQTYSPFPVRTTPYTEEEKQEIVRQAMSQKKTPEEVKINEMESDMEIIKKQNYEILKYLKMVHQELTKKK